MCPAQYAAVATILMIGDFQAPTPPAIPGLPPVTAGNPPPAINVGAAGDPAADSAGSPSNANPRETVPFANLAFCEAAGPDGQPRSASWIAACIASAQ
jgi:hypothetical protein